MKLRFASWNILADSLSCNEFITDGGDSKNCHWNVRKDKISKIIVSMFKTQKIDCLALQENDHPHWIKNEIEKNGLKMVHLVRSKSQLKMSKTMMIKIENCWNCLKSTGKVETQIIDVYQKFQYLNGLLKDDKISKTVLRSCGITSFADEFAEDFKCFYSFSEDFYLVDHGISIIYNPGVLEFTKFHEKTAYPISTHSQNIYQEKLYSSKELVISAHGVLAAEFKEIASSKQILVYGCHLPSSIGPELETIRVNHVKNLIDYSKSKDFLHRTVFLMDSNTSNLTEAEELVSAPALMTLSPAVDSLDFKNCVRVEGNECFKMRHAQGGQPAKFGSLMFDAIDKILVHKSNDSVEIEFPWKSEILSEVAYEMILKLRTDGNSRQKLKNVCTEREWGDDMNKNCFDHEKIDLDESVFMKLFPNHLLPSDHPPVAAEIHFNS